MNCLTKFCPAKVNLYLKVLGKRADGFHELETLMVPVSFGDRLTVDMADSDINLRLTSRYSFAGNLDSVSQIPTDDKNLIIRVAKEFRRAIGENRGAAFCLHKNLPAGGGLGGASSNAATALQLLNQLWNVHWEQERLAKFSETFGSDIPFFFAQSAAICRGRGEHVTATSCYASCWFLILRPPFGLSTPAVFSQMRNKFFQISLTETGREYVKQSEPLGNRHHETGFMKDSQAIASLESMVAKLNSGDWVHVAKDVVNDLELPATQLRPEFQNIQTAFRSSGALGMQMSGSGSCYFGIFRNQRQAVQASQRIKSLGVGRVDLARPFVMTCH